VISVLVKNDAGELAPVLSMIKEFQEPGTRAFQELTGCGEVSGNQGYLDWVQIGVVPTEILQPPSGGKQQLNIVVRLVDMNNIPSINLGYSDSSESLWTGIETYDYNFEVSGYLEEAEHKDKAQSLTIKIGMAVAMADGTLDDSEGNILKNWIVSALSHHTGEKRESETIQFFEMFPSESSNVPSAIATAIPILIVRDCALSLCSASSRYPLTSKL
jgi:hypothetical protein